LPNSDPEKIIIMAMNCVNLEDPKPPPGCSAESHTPDWGRKELERERKWEEFNINPGTPPAPLDLPENTELIFLNEGAANIVYKIRVPSSSEKFEKNPWEGLLSLSSLKYNVIPLLSWFLTLSNRLLFFSVYTSNIFILYPVSRSNSFTRQTSPSSQISANHAAS
jgi:hypothetical protein